YLDDQVIPESARLTMLSAGSWIFSGRARLSPGLSPVRSQEPTIDRNHARRPVREPGFAASIHGREVVPRLAVCGSRLFSAGWFAGGTASIAISRAYTP